MLHGDMASEPVVATNRAVKAMKWETMQRVAKMEDGTADIAMAL